MKVRISVEFPQQAFVHGISILVGDSPRDMRLAGVDVLGRGELYCSLWSEWGSQHLLRCERW